MTFWPRFLFSRNDSGNQVEIKDIFTLRPAPSTEFRGRPCCSSQIDWGPNICKVLPGCITHSKTPINSPTRLCLKGFSLFIKESLQVGRPSGSPDASNAAGWFPQRRRPVPLVSGPQLPQPLAQVPHSSIALKYFFLALCDPPILWHSVITDFQISLALCDPHAYV